jgi:hypothetical protein
MNNSKFQIMKILLLVTVVFLTACLYSTGPLTPEVTCENLVTPDVFVWNDSTVANRFTTPHAYDDTLRVYGQNRNDPTYGQLVAMVIIPGHTGRCLTLFDSLLHRNVSTR